MTQGFVGDAATRGIGKIIGTKYIARGGKGGLRRYSYTLRHTSDLDVRSFHHLHYHYYYYRRYVRAWVGATRGLRSGKDRESTREEGETHHPDHSNLHDQSHCIPTRLSLAGEYFFTD